MSTTPRFTALPDAAAVLGVSYDKAWRATIRHRIPCRREGRLRVVDLNALAAALGVTLAGRA